MKPLLIAVLLMSSPALAKIIETRVPYELGKVRFEGVLVYDDAPGQRPGLVMAPNWMGVTEANVKQAAGVASQGYVVFVADLYGKGAQPKNAEEAGKLAGSLKADRKLLRERIRAALDELLESKAPVDRAKVGAIGFCFGGTAALDLARSGATLAGVVTFHGGLSTPTPQDAKNIKGKILALHGADDPAVPPDEVKGFEDEMRAAKVDWQLVKFGGAVHSFTDPDAKTPGRSEYNPKAAKRAFQMMKAFFDEAFAS